MPDNGLRDVAVISRMAFALIAALAGWVVAWCVLVAYLAALAAIHNLPPQYPTTWDIAPVLGIYTFAVVLVVTLVFGVPYVAIRSTAGMLQRPWRFYVDTGLAGTVTIIVYYLLIYRWRWPKEIISGFIAAVGISLVTAIVTSFVYLGLLRWRSRKRIDGLKQVQRTD